ncbi:MAG: hypothetical protein ACOC9Z_08665, partial [Chloroflexota bacterium]
ADMGFTGTNVGHWENGRRAIKHQDRLLLRRLIIVLHRYGGLQTLDEANAMLESGFYSRLTLEEAAEIDATWAEEMEGGSRDAHPTPLSPVAIVVSPEAVYESFDAVFRWSEADEHARSSWAGMLLWSMATLAKRLTLDSFFRVLAYLFLWAVTALMIAPILSWPLSEPSLRQRAALLFALAPLVTPLAIAMLTSPDAPADSTTEALDGRRELFLLKLMGAVVGFGIIALTLFFLALGAYYVGFVGEAASWGWRLAAGGALLLAHVGARRIPADRYRLHNGKVWLHKTDITFLLAFLLSGAAVGALVYRYYDIMASPATGLSVAVVAAAYALWERQKRDPAPEPLLIVALGALAPFTILFLYFFFFPSPLMEATLQSLPAVTLASTFVYILSLTLVIVTALTRERIRITLRGALGFLTLQLLPLFLSWLGPGWVLGAAAFAVILWLGWGRRRFGRHFSLHPGIVVLLIALLAAIRLQTTSAVSPWFILVGYMIISGGLMLWVFGIGEDRVGRNGDVEVE